MDFVKRILKIVKDNTGIAVFIGVAKPNPYVGYLVPYNTEAYPTATTTAADMITFFRTFVMNNFNVGAGIIAFRRTGRTVFGNFNYYLLQADAENFARANKIQYILDASTNTSINLGSYDPTAPGDGVADE